MDITLNTDNSLNDSAIVANKLASLGAASEFNISENLSDAEKAKIAEAARGFESMYIHMMLKEMKSAMLEEEDGEDTFGADTLQGVTDMMFSESLANTGTGIGIAEMVYSQLTGGDQLRAITVEKQENVTPLYEMLRTAKNAAESSNNIEQSVTEQLQQNFGGSFYDKIERRLAAYSGIIEEASEKYGISEELIKSIITAESAGKAGAKSSAGAKGLMQLMDGTAKDMGVTNSYDPEENIMGGSKYISKMLKKFDGNTELALAAYNAGPGNVMKYDGIPPFKETQSYIRKVSDYLTYFSQKTNDNNE